MSIIELRCPNCGATVAPQTRKCEYCGAYLVFQNNALTTTGNFQCPYCGTSLGTGSFICVKCEKILVSDEETISILKSQQKRIRFMQDKLRQGIGFDVVRNRLDPKEMIYHTSGRRRGLLLGADVQFVVTDKRIIAYTNGKLDEIPYEEIVTIGQPVRLTLPDYGTVGYQVTVTTFNGDIKFTFGDYGLALHFLNAANRSFNNCTGRRKDITALLCFDEL